MNQTYAMQSLTSCAMAILRCQRLLSAQLILHLSAVAATFPDCVEVLVISMDRVWWIVFPLILFTIRGIASLELMAFISCAGTFLGDVLLALLIVVFVRHFDRSSGLESSNGV